MVISRIVIKGYFYFILQVMYSVKLHLIDEIRGIECPIIHKSKVCEKDDGVIKAVPISAVSYW